MQLCYFQKCTQLPVKGLYQCKNGCSQICIDCLAGFATCSICQEECHVQSKCAFEILQILQSYKKPQEKSDFNQPLLQNIAFAIGLLAILIGALQFVSLWKMIFVLITASIGSAIGIAYQSDQMDNEMNKFKQEKWGGLKSVVFIMFVWPSLIGIGAVLGATAGFATGVLLLVILSMF